MLDKNEIWQDNSSKEEGEKMSWYGNECKHKNVPVVHLHAGSVLEQIPSVLTNIDEWHDKKSNAAFDQALKYMLNELESERIALSTSWWRKLIGTNNFFCTSIDEDLLKKALICAFEGQWWSDFCDNPENSKDKTMTMWLINNCFIDVFTRNSWSNKWYSSVWEEKRNNAKSEIFTLRSACRNVVPNSEVSIPDDHEFFRFITKVK